MQKNKTIPAAALIACLTIAAYVLAQAASMIMSRSIDAALLSNSEPVVQNCSEITTPPLPHLKASNKSKSSSVPEGNTGSGVKVTQVSDTEWVLDRASILANTRDLNRCLMQARAVPLMKHGRTVGFRITRISRDSIYEKIGLRNGDVLLQVNMRNLDNSSRFFSLYQEMRNKRHISILLSRNGQNQTFYYDIR